MSDTTRWPKSGPTLPQRIEEANRTANGGEVDWDQVPTERQAEEWAILHGVDRLLNDVESLAEEAEGIEGAPGELTPALVAESLHMLAFGLAELTRLFRAHLKVNDLDDSAQALGISGGGRTLTREEVAALARRQDA